MIQSRSKRLRARTSMLIIHESGQAEINCEHCKKGVFMPLTLSEGPFEMRKAEPRLLLGPLTSPEGKRQE